MEKLKKKNDGSCENKIYPLFSVYIYIRVKIKYIRYLIFVSIF